MDESRAPANNGFIYAIIDKQTKAISGGLMIYRHDAPAIRTFSDLLADPRAEIIHRHPEDFELYRLGFITIDNTISAESTLVLTGEKWAAMHRPSRAD